MPLHDAFRRIPRGLARALVALALALSAAADDARPGIFRITPLRPVAELRAEALAQSPPPEPGPFRPVELVELTALDPTIRLDVRYATADNFLSTPVYPEARAFLQRPAAEALVRAHRALRGQGFGLLIHDAYRPWWVTKLFWDATPAEKRDFVADPLRRDDRALVADVCGRHTGGPAAEGPAAGGDAARGLHGLRVRVVALRLLELARVPDLELVLRPGRPTVIAGLLSSGPPRFGRYPRRRNP